MTEEETAEALGIGLRTAKRDWAKAKSWLHQEPIGGAGSERVSASPTERFRRVDTIFDAALDLPDEEQTAFIERGVRRRRGAARRSAGAGARLSPLRQRSRIAGRADRRAAARRRAWRSPDRSPTASAPFRVVREIGRGGMGRVFLGERADGQFEQRVAIKLIQHGAPGVLRRFVEERRILALLEHPGIARLVDGGITAGGLPYFAMELVEGEPIDRYCERARADARPATGALRRRVRRRGLRPPAPHHPSRPQAVQHPGHGRRAR